MKVVVTGAAGFIGIRLARTLAARDALCGAPIDRIVLADRVLPDSGANDARATAVQGDLGDPAFAARLIDADTRCVFHLAGVVSGAAEADFALGMRANLDGTRNLLEACRALAHPARLVYASSIAVFGRPLPYRIDDATQAHPTLSYGTQKRVCELLLDEYTRRGFVDARALRLPGIVVRPVLPNGALSAFNSDLIREPLAGRDYTAPVSPDAVIWVQSIERCIGNLLHAAQLPEGTLGARRTLNLPCTIAGIGEIVTALGRAGGAAAAARVRYAPDAALQAQFGAWPREFRAERALALGFAADASIDAIIRAHIDAARTRA